MADSLPPATCALFDEAGARVLCMKTWPDWTTPLCTTTLALLNPLHDHWGDWYRTLMFPHDEWVEESGVWRETRRARMLRLKGRSPAARDTSSDRLYTWGLADRRPRGPVWYPTFVRCPACSNKRLLVGGVLDVVTLGDVTRHVSQRALAEGLSLSGLDPVLLRDATGERIALTPYEHGRRRDARRSVGRKLQGSPQDLPQALRDRAVLTEEIRRMLEEAEQFLKDRGSRAVLTEETQRLLERAEQVLKRRQSSGPAG